MTTRPQRGLEPLITPYRLRFLDEAQLRRLQEATLHLLETVGVRIPSTQVLDLAAEAGAIVDHTSGRIRFPPDLVLEAIEAAPRHFHLAGGTQEFDLHLENGGTFLTTDGCGVRAIDPATGETRPSTKADLARAARIADALPEIHFMWPIVAASDCGQAARLHELDAAWSNTWKHAQVMVGTAIEARYALEMAAALTGSGDAVRARPPFSNLICTVSPLMLDPEGMEAALLLAGAGVPVGFMAMPTVGTTAPATRAGALVVGDAEVIAAIVLVQLASPGAPVFHSILQAWADPRTGDYIGSPQGVAAHYASVEIGHHWGLSTLAGALGTESLAPGVWQAAADVALDPVLVLLSGSELVTGVGLNDTYTCMHPEGMILDVELVERARNSLERLEVDDETLAAEVIETVGPGGHFLGQPHTRRHLRDAMRPGITHERGADGVWRDPVEVARERFDAIIGSPRCERIDPETRRELDAILVAAERELRQR